MNETQPILRPPNATPTAWQRYWDRHRRPINRVLHLLGVPMCFAVAPILVVIQLMNGAWDLWWRPAAIFLGGYALQFIGHALEGNDAGEVCAVLKFLGKPYKPVAEENHKEPGAECKWP